MPSLMKVALFPILALSLLCVPNSQAQFAYAASNNAVAIVGYSGPGGPVVIPNSVNGLPVTVIGAGAFQTKGITSVVIPNSVTNIGRDAFYDCASLTNIVLGNGITSIAQTTFGYCIKL